MGIRLSSGGQTSWLKGTPIALRSAESQVGDRMRTRVRIYKAWDATSRGYCLSHYRAPAVSQGASRWRSPCWGLLVWRAGEKAFWAQGSLRVSDGAQNKGVSPVGGLVVGKQVGGWCPGSELSGVSATRGTCPHLPT